MNVFSYEYRTQKFLTKLSFRRSFAYYYNSLHIKN